jgi:hypothetical protein
VKSILPVWGDSRKFPGRGGAFVTMLIEADEEPVDTSQDNVEVRVDCSGNEKGGRTKLNRSVDETSVGEEKDSSVSERDRVLSNTFGSSTVHLAIPPDATMTCAMSLIFGRDLCELYQIGVRLGEHQEGGQSRGQIWMNTD